jgi:hypothetical protein
MLQEPLYFAFILPFVVKFLYFLENSPFLIHAVKVEIEVDIVSAACSVECMSDAKFTGSNESFVSCIIKK